MTTTAEQMRAWNGPAVLTYGFRPLFLLAGTWAVLAMALWIVMLGGWLTLPARFDPVSWHAHEMLFGFLSAVIAGFLLTAVPNWTGRLPIVGWPLAMLSIVWLAGRVAIALSDWLPGIVVAVVDCSFLAVLLAAIGREILSGRNWRNLPVLAMLGLFLTGNAIFHWESETQFAASGYGMRLGVAVAIMLISLVGGRIVPSFTRNWLVKQGSAARPVPFGALDRTVLATMSLAVLAWVISPSSAATGWLLLLSGMLQGWRLLRWAGSKAGAEPLVWVLHAGYAFVALGALVLGMAVLDGDGMLLVAAQHLWMAGAIGLMPLAVMTRATLGHCGRPLVAGSGTTAIYLAIIASATIRVAAGVFPDAAMLFYSVSGLLWVIGFTGFVALYGPLLLRPRA